MMQDVSAKNDLVGKIAGRYGLRLLFLFGSRVSGRIHKESDYDFGYLAEQNLSLEAEGHLIFNLARFAGAKDEREINLVNFKKASPLLLYSALNNAQALYEKEEGIFANLQAYAFKRYIETLPLFKLKAERVGVVLK